MKNKLVLSFISRGGAVVSSGGSYSSGQGFESLSRYEIKILNKKDDEFNYGHSNRIRRTRGKSPCGQMVKTWHFLC